MSESHSNSGFNKTRLQVAYSIALPLVLSWGARFLGMICIDLILRTHISQSCQADWLCAELPEQINRINHVGTSNLLREPIPGVNSTEVETIMDSVNSIDNTSRGVIVSHAAY